MKSVNIWLIHHYANSPDTPGDARHFSHARELIRRGHRVRVVACSLLHLQQRETVAHHGTWQSVSYDGVPFTWIRASAYTGQGVRRIWNMLEFAWRVVRRGWARGLDAPDLVLGSSPDPFAALAAERVASHYRVPFVLEIRDAWPYVLTEVGGYSVRHPFVRAVDRIMRFLYARAARIVMFSRDSAALLTRYGADPTKIVWVPHGVDLAMCPTPRPAPDDGIFTVTYIGAHNQWNSLDAILDAAKILQASETKPMRLQFVGGGSRRQGLQERARAEGIANVAFIDSMPKTEIQQVLHGSDAFILNNREDGVSKNWMSFNKLYEYLAAGRPVVFGTCTQNDPVRESGAGLSVAADDPRALAEAIASLSESTPEQLAEFGRLGRKHIETFYSIPVLVDRFERMAYEICPIDETVRDATPLNPAHPPSLRV